jgi:hypothetical protein
VHFTTEYARQSNGDAHLFDFCFRRQAKPSAISLSSTPTNGRCKRLESASLSLGSHSNPTLQNCRNRGHAMGQPSSDPPVADQAPTADVLTAYDQNHAAIYLRLLDAEAEGADWAEVARIVLHIDPALEPERARRAWETHLERAKWMTRHGFKHLLRGGPPN